MRKMTAGLLGGLLLLSGIACSDDDGGGVDAAATATPAETGAEIEGDLINAVLTAAEAAEDAGTARLNMTVDVAVGGADVAVEAVGKFDFANDVGKMTMVAKGGTAASSIGTMDVLVDGEHMYVRGPAFEPLLGGKKWGRIDLTAPGAASSQLNQDPTQYLEWLEAAGGGVEELGRHHVQGTPATHYRADVSIDEIVEQAPDKATAKGLRAGFDVFGEMKSFPVEVWVDDDGLPRRIHVLLESETKDGLRTEVTINLFKYGVAVKARTPNSFKDVNGLGG